MEAAFAVAGIVLIVGLVCWMIERQL